MAVANVEGWELFYSQVNHDWLFAYKAQIVEKEKALDFKSEQA